MLPLRTCGGRQLCCLEAACALRSLSAKTNKPEPKQAASQCTLVCDVIAMAVRRVLKGQGSLDHFVKTLKPIMEPKLAKTRKRQAVKQSVCQLRGLLDIKAELGLASPLPGPG